MEHINCSFSKNTFDRVQKQLKFVLKPNAKRHDFAFTKLIKCGECGASITAECIKKYYKRTNRNVAYTYYHCTRKLKPCSQKPITEPELELQIRKAVDDVALPKTWAKDWYKWLEKDELLEKQLLEENIKKLNLQLQDLDRKSKLLLDGYLDQVIDPETYKIKKNELFEEKLKIEQDLVKIKQYGSSWLEPFKNFIGSALSCAKIARSKNTSHDLAIMGKTVGSNFFLTNRRLSVCYNRPFAELCAPQPAQSRSTQDFEKSRAVGGEGIEPPTLSTSMIRSTS